MYVCRCAMDCLSWSGRIGTEQLYAYCRQYHWNGVDRKSIVKLCAHYWQQVPHERHARLYIPIWIWIRIWNWIWIWIQGSAMSADICFVREKIIHKKLSYCCMVYICICTYIPRWNQLSSRREIALRMDCQALTCWMLMNGTCVVALISRTWTWMRAIGYWNIDIIERNIFVYAIYLIILYQLISVIYQYLHLSWSCGLYCCGHHIVLF